MENLIRFFIDRPKLNYTLALFLAIAGIFAYIITPKEIFPPMVLPKLVISGSYTGASANNLDKMAVSDIEDEVKNISGVTKVESTISQGAFMITLTIKESYDLADRLNKVKDAIAKIKPNLPSDMNEPTVITFEHKIPLMQISVSSETLNSEELLKLAKDIKKEISNIPNITDAIIYGESDKQIEFEIDTMKVEAYGINKKDVISAISNLSYIYPIGKIEERGSHLYITMNYGKDSKDELSKTLVRVGDKKVYLGDIAKVDFKYADSETKSSFNGQNSLVMNVSKDEEGNAIELSRKIKERLKEIQAKNPQSTLEHFSDTSVYIKNRLNTVISNITLGFILVSLSMYFLINGRISFVVAVGIPFSFLIGIIFLNLSDYSINMITLLGALIAVGVLVDDAIVVSENIQRHIEEGMEPKEAAIVGTKEVMMPVIMATITTIFAFTPMLLMSGEMGVFIKMIPIAISVLLVASLIESFFFLPLHSKHVMKKDARTLSWEKANNLYKNILTRLMHHKRASLIFFFVVVPLLTFVAFSNMKFQFFPKFDGTEVYVNGKLDINNKIEDTHEVVKKIEKEILAHKDELFIKSISAVTGFRMGGSGMDQESAPNVFMFFISLKDPVEDNFIERYITPVLAFDFSSEPKERTLKTFEVEDLLREQLNGVKERFSMIDFSVEGQRAGVVKKDIEIELLVPDDAKMLQMIEKIKEGLGKIDGVQNIGDNAKEGVLELKLKINGYGESLGVSEQYLASILSDYYLFGKRGKSFGDDGIMEIRTKDEDKDNLGKLKSFTFLAPSGGKVRLNDVVDFVQIKSFEKIIKKNGDKQKSVYASVDPKIVTASEAIKKIEPLIEEIKKEGVAIRFGGEKEQNAQLMQDMMIASVIAIFLMFLSLLYMFESFKATLMILSVIPLSFLGVSLGHHLLGINLTMPSVIGILGLAGVVINDGIVMLDFIRKVSTESELLHRAALRLRPIILTSLTTFIGLSTLIFFPSGQAVVLQPLAVSLGFGLAWGTILNLFYLPMLYALINRTKEDA